MRPGENKARAGYRIHGAGHFHKKGKYMSFQDILDERAGDGFELSPEYVDRLAESHSEFMTGMEADSAKIGELTELLAQRDSEISNLKAQLADMNLQLPAEQPAGGNDDDEENNDEGDGTDVDVSDLFEDVN